MRTSKTLAMLSFAGLIAVAASAMAQTPSPAVAQGRGLFRAGAAPARQTNPEPAARQPRTFWPAKTPDDIFNVLKNGPMMAMASGLSDDEMKSIAAYLTAGGGAGRRACQLVAALHGGRSSPAAIAQGATVFKGRCSDCHDPAAGDAPEKAVLAQKDPGDIFNILKSGPMTPMAAGLSDDDMHAVAAYLTAK